MATLSKPLQSVKKLWGRSRNAGDNSTPPSKQESETVTEMTASAEDTEPREEFTKPVTLVIIGCGQRGRVSQSVLNNCCDFTAKRFHHTVGLRRVRLHCTSQMQSGRYCGTSSKDQTRNGHRP